MAHRYILYWGCTPEKLKYTKKAGVVASWLLHCYQYVMQHYSERYDRVIQVQNFEI